MSKKVFLGMAMAMMALLMISCNKNQYDFSALEGVEGQGQWKLPIASAGTTLGKVLDQLGENQMISYDPQGNIQMTYHFGLDNVIVGEQLMKMNDVTGSAHFEVENTVVTPLPEPIDTVVFCDQYLVLSSDEARLVSATIKEGFLVNNVISNFEDITKIIFRSSDIVDANGNTLEAVLDNNLHASIDMAGRTINMGEENTLNFSYEIQYRMQYFLEPLYTFDVTLAAEDWKIESLTGYVDAYTTNYEFSQDFSLPLNHISGELDLVDSRITISERNTFDLDAQMNILDAALYGEGVQPSPIFDVYPTVVTIVPSNTMTDVLEKTVSVNVNTKHQSIKLSGDVVFNPNGAENLITICDTSSISFGVDAVMPLKCKVPDVIYYDTTNLSLGEIKFPELVQEILLTVDVASELPFDINAQLLTYDSKHDRVTDSLLTSANTIPGCYGDTPATSKVELSLTKGRLANLLASDKLLMRLGINTDNHVVVLDKEDGIGITIKADVIYGDNAGNQ